MLSREAGLKDFAICECAAIRVNSQRLLRMREPWLKNRSSTKACSRRYWRITSFGALTENPAAAAGDLLIRADWRNWPTGKTPVDWGRVTGRQRRMLVPVGELPRLHLNAVLHDGRLANDLVDRLEFERWMRREINCDRSNITVITRDHKDDQGNYVVPVRAKWASQLSDHDRHGLFVAFGSGEDPMR